MLIQFRKKSRGSAIVEIGPALWILFMVFTFPLTLLGSWGIRHAIVVNAVHTAAALGSRCKSFQTNTSSSDLSATNTVNQIIQQTATNSPGLTIQQVTTYIVVRSLSGSSSSQQTTPLSLPANTGANAYNLKVSVQMQEKPWFAYPILFFGNIPGLTAPATITVQSESFFENTQGLTQ
jgi:hypothetical protein